MSHVKSLQALFKRYRRPGDIVYASIALVFSVFLLSQLLEQTAWRAGDKLFAQPRFWPAVGLLGMVAFATLHLMGSLLSERIEGRWKEVLLWLSAFEYAAWFVAYAVAVPLAGYLPATVLFAVLLTLRVGYRSALMLGSAALAAVLIVLLFKTFLKVNLPAGQIYETLPDGLRQLMLVHF